ncbi:unnamed protein product [Urochloa decumbens]|uniref:Uncharacterized protein n=1 Tax=Urochloa decumbens TaxID=240449 RepID=A0ABC9H4W2_9POAL
MAVLAAVAVLLLLRGGAGAGASFNGSSSEDASSSSLAQTMQWGNAKATWYGQPNGAGPYDNGGACGFKNVNQYPFLSMTSCGNQPLFRDGKGCGSCYKIRCSDKDHPACSGRTETVVITDMNYSPVSKYHFDLSGTALGKLAKPGRSDDLRRAGIIGVEFARVPCEFPGLKVGFHVEEGSTQVYFAVLVEYENGDGDVTQVDLMESGGRRRWAAMRESWGSVWRLDSNHRLQPPFSIRLRSDSGKTLVARDVIPTNWRPNTFYRSFVQYS